MKYVLLLMTTLALATSVTGASADIKGKGVTGQACHAHRPNGDHIDGKYGQDNKGHPTSGFSKNDYMVCDAPSVTCEDGGDPINKH